MVPLKLISIEISDSLRALSRAITTQANLSLVRRVVESTMTCRLRDFVRMNPCIFLLYKVGEDPLEFLDGLYKVLSAMWVISREKEEFDSYTLRDVSVIWDTQGKDNWPVESYPIEWEEFKETFLRMYYARERRDVKEKKFFNLKQGIMTVEEYSLKF